MLKTITFNTHGKAIGQYEHLANISDAIYLDELTKCNIYVAKMASNIIGLLQKKCRPSEVSYKLTLPVRFIGS